MGTRIGDGGQVDLAVHPTVVVEGGQGPCQPGGVGKEVGQVDRLVGGHPIGHGGAPGPLRDGIGPTFHLGDREHPGQVGVGGLGGAAHRFHELAAPRSGRFRPEASYQDRPVQGGVGREPLLDVAVPAESDLE